MSVVKQIENLRKLASAKTMDIFLVIIVLGVVICALAGVYSGTLPYYFFSGFLLIAFFSTRQSRLHIRRAAAALDKNVPSKLTINVEITEWTDSYTYQALCVIQSSVWKITFIPTGWQPTAGPVEVDAYFMPGIICPVLMISDRGIIVPQSTPKQVSARPAA